MVVLEVCPAIGRPAREVGTLRLGKCPTRGVADQDVGEPQRLLPRQVRARPDGPAPYGPRTRDLVDNQSTPCTDEPLTGPAVAPGCGSAGGGGRVAAMSGIFFPSCPGGWQPIASCVGCTQTEGTSECR